MTRNQELWNLPHGWQWTRVDELGPVYSGATPSTKEPEYWGGDVVWVTPADLSGYTDKRISRGAKSLTQRGLNACSAMVMPKGTVLFSSRAPVGYVAIADVELATNQGFKSVRPLGEVLPDFVYYYFKSAKSLAETRASGTTFKELSGKAFAALPVPLAPAPEQRRIVARIEELFSELDKAVESLTTARVQLKTYRQALLEHAFEGRLTEQWRREHADELESADKLLARIREERAARYRQQLEDWEAGVARWEADGRAGKKPRKLNAPVDIEPLGEYERAQLPQLPKEWQWQKIGEVFSVHVGATPSRANLNYWGGEIRWVSSGEVAFCGISETREGITEEGVKNTSTLVHPPGTVILAMIGEGRTRGQAAILHVEASHNQNTAAIRVSETGVDPRYVYYFLLYRYVETRRIGSGNNQKALNKTRVQEMQFPLAPVAEQRQMIDLVEAKLSQIDQLEQTINTALQQAEALRQSILKRAFEGRLVPQDPNDEPAADLLARIRAEHAGQPLRQGRRRGTKTEATAS